MLGVVTSTVRVGPFQVADVAPGQLATDMVRVSLSKAEPTLAFALHVGGLNRARDSDVTDVLNEADYLYADGASVVLLARIAGAQRCARTPTTDLGWIVIDRLAEELGRSPRLALIGGRPGLAKSAGARLNAESRGEVVLAEHGFHDEWSSVLRRLRQEQPDLLILGLGMPLEASVAVGHRDDLPPCLVLTCGGWFGFLANEERRAPRVLQRLGLEWTFRLMQSPTRLAGRYVRGAWNTLRLVPAQVKSRECRKGG